MSIMKMHKNWSFYMMLLIVASSLVSCIPQRHIVLMQNKDNGKEIYDALDSITSRYRLQPNDYLFVNVSSPDENLSAFFNPQSHKGGTSSNQNTQFYYYMLDDNMDIDMPVVGKINLSGCNLESAKKKINDAISAYLSDFQLIVRLTSNSYTILGEVNGQGVKTMARDQITIYDAIAQAGGFTSYARRSEVKLLRKDNEGRVHTYMIDVTDDNIINSDLYYIYPNDILYVRPMKVKTLGFGEVLSMSLVTSLITLYLLVRSLKD